ncbi:MAG: DUF2889 domain-containing protein [Burkholderiaceae bacterium]
MSLPPASSPRKLLHTRSIDVQAYQRDDGLVDLEAHLTDIKPVDTPLAAGSRSAGQPIHDLWLRLTIDDRYQVIAVQARSAAVPYTGYCDTIAPAYEALIGTNLLKGFRSEVKARVGNTLGCTHLSELSAIVPTVAVQAMAGGRSPSEDSDVRPFQIDRCHALAADGPGVLRYYPKWYRKKSSGEAIT